MTATERTGWRDQDLSERHRRWGVDVPAVDVDFLLLEYDNETPVAIIDYKHNREAAINLKRVEKEKSNLTAQSRLYTEDGKSLPFFVAWYCITPFWTARVQAFNESAKATIGMDATPPMLEDQYVKWLHGLRVRAAPEGLLRHLKRRETA